MSTPLIVKNLVKKYGTLSAVDNISFEVNKNEIFALIGPNGAGKSTTLRIISTVLNPTSGSVKIYGMDIQKEASSIRPMISYLPEEAGAYKNMRGIEYLNFMAGIYSPTKTKQKEMVAYAKDITDLKSRIKDKISTYSKGMTRKLLLARAVMNKPKLAILDEPTSGLDVINALYIRQMIRNLAKKGMSVLLSSHNMLEIEFLSDRIGIIHNGKIMEIGKPAGIMQKYKSKNLEEVFNKINKKD